MNILITGGCGYVGSVLVPKLLDLGHKVRVVDIGWFGNSLPKDAEVIEGNICKFEDRWLYDIDSVIHLAATSNDPMAEFDPFTNYVLNASATAYIVQKAKSLNVNKFIFASTCSVYGFNNDFTFYEDSQSYPTFPYAISKLMAEESLRCATDYRFTPIILRKGTIGGYSPRMRYDLVVNTMTKFALTRNKITVNNPLLWRPIVDIRDVADAYVKALNADIGGIYNIAENNYSILEIAENIAGALDVLNHKKPEIEVLNVEDLRSYRVSTIKAEHELGFKAKYKIFDTVKEILSHDDIMDFNNKKYYNIDIFKERRKEIL
jgi:nucleoside-diphosphate-sugar epimerase